MQKNFNDYLGGEFKKKSPPRYNNKFEKDPYSPPNQNFRYAEEL